MAKEYIERDAVAKKAICMHGFGNVKYVPLSAIMNQTAADVVEVVRCKDCKHGVWDEGELLYRCVYDEDDLFPVYEDADFYCARGERRDNNA